MSASLVGRNHIACFCEEMRWLVDGHLQSWIRSRRARHTAAWPRWRFERQFVDQHQRDLDGVEHVAHTVSVNTWLASTPRMWSEADRFIVRVTPRIWSDDLLAISDNSGGIIAFCFVLFVSVLSALHSKHASYCNLKTAVQHCTDPAIPSQSRVTYFISFTV